jgi:hypothetical protein
MWTDLACQVARREGPRNQPRDRARRIQRSQVGSAHALRMAIELPTATPTARIGYIVTTDQRPLRVDGEREYDRHRP